MGAQAITGAFRAVSAAVLHDEAGLEPVETRLSWKTAKHALARRALPKDHPVHVIMNGMVTRGKRHRSPLYDTWLQYHRTVLQGMESGISPRLAYGLPPWVDLHDTLIVTEELSALRMHQKIISSNTKHSLLYTDASVRNNLAGVSVIRYARRGNRRIYAVAYQATIGRAKTCTATTAEIYAIKTALKMGRQDKDATWIFTDSQEALQLLHSRGRSTKSRDAVLDTLRELQLLREEGGLAKIAWIPGHKGIIGNERAHNAAQEMTKESRRADDRRLQVRELQAISRILKGVVEAETPRKASKWGSYTYAIDGALPGKHTLQLYGKLMREEAGILAQARTGHTHLNDYRARIKLVESPMCDCTTASESVRHVLFQCSRWRTEREILRITAGDRWGDISYLLGGRSRRLDPRTGEPITSVKHVSLVRSDGRRFLVHQLSTAIISVAQSTIWKRNYRTDSTFRSSLRNERTALPECG